MHLTGYMTSRRTFLISGRRTRGLPLTFEFSSAYFTIHNSRADPAPLTCVVDMTKRLRRFALPFRVSPRETLRGPGEDFRGSTRGALSFGNARGSDRPTRLNNQGVYSIMVNFFFDFK